MSTCLEFQPIYGTVFTSAPAWTGGARSNAEFTGDGWFGWSVPRASVGVAAGLNTENVGEHYIEISHGFMFQRGMYKIIESGATILGPVVYFEGDRFYIMRLGQRVLYMRRPAAAGTNDFYTDSSTPGVQLPGEIIRISQQPSLGKIFLDASLYAVGDQIVDEAAGYVWYPGGELSESPSPASGAVLEIPFLVAGTQGIAATGAVGNVEIPFALLARSIHEEGARLEIPFRVLGADVPINTSAILEIPFEVTAYGNDPDAQTLLSGAVLGIPFEVEGATSLRNVGAALEIPFRVQGFATSYGELLESGALLEIPFEVFATGTDDVETPLTAGALLEIPFEVFGTGTDDVETPLTAGALLEIPFDVTAVGGTADANIFRIALSFTPVISGEGEADIAETLMIPSDVVGVVGIRIRERLATIAAYQSFYNPQGDIAEAAAAATAQQVVLGLSLADSVATTDALAFQRALVVAEQLLATGQAQTFLQAMSLVAEALTTADRTREATPVGISDAVDIATATALTLTRIAELAEAVTAEDATGLLLTIVVNETSSAVATDAMEALGHYLAGGAESLGIWAGFKLGDELQTGWVMNTEGNNALSEYTNYPFNSFAEMDGRYYGADDTGVYLLDGEDDQGTPIDASVLTRFVDFNSTVMKRVPTAYLGYTADGRMVMRVRAVSGGELREHWFTATPRNADAPREQVVQLGRGIRSRYWQFELANVDGADFELDTLELYPVFLSRRV